MLSSNKIKDLEARIWRRHYFKTKKTKEMGKEFYLLLDSCFCCSYAVTIWLEEFQHNKNFKGVLIRENQPSVSLIKRRNDFHRYNAGQKIVNPAILRELKQLYPYFDETEQAMINLFGIPKYSINHAVNTFFLGQDINGELAQSWTKNNIHNSQPLIFSHLGQIIKPWWIHTAGGYLFNVHSAVLPYARGIYAIENIAATRDVDSFRKSTGISIHLIDKGVDTGAIISASKICQPLRFDSIWELKGYIYELGYQKYAEMAKRFIFNHPTLPVPIASNPNLHGPNFKYKDFTEQQKRRAEEGYLAMKLNKIETPMN